MLECMILYCSKVCLYDFFIIHTTSGTTAGTIRCGRNELKRLGIDITTVYTKKITYFKQTKIDT